MDLTNTIETLRHIEHALDIVRDELAGGGEIDITLRQDEIVLEVLQSNFKKRYTDALQLHKRAAIALPARQTA